MVAARSLIEPPFPPHPETILAHQARCPAAVDGRAIITQLPRHTRAATGIVRQREHRSGICQQHHVLLLTATSRAPIPGKVAVTADTKDMAQAMHGKLLLRLFDEPEAHRLPRRAKKAVARSEMSRFWRRISFSRRMY